MLWQHKNTTRMTQIPEYIFVYIYINTYVLDMYLE